MPGPVDENIDLAAAIGRCSNDWSHAEYQLALLFSVLSKMDITSAVTVFSFFRNVRTQSEVLKQLAKVSPLNVTDENLHALGRLMKLYEDLAGRRNRIAHNPIGRTPDENALYIMLRRKSPPIGELPYESVSISVDEINELATEIMAFNTALMALTFRLAKFPISFSREELLSELAPPD
ncbi:hypothetical protein [Bradyrhizobium sp. USDA 10063]